MVYSQNQGKRYDSLDDDDISISDSILEVLTHQLNSRADYLPLFRCLRHVSVLTGKVPWIWVSMEPGKGSLSDCCPLPGELYRVPCKFGGGWWGGLWQPGPPQKMLATAPK